MRVPFMLGCNFGWNIILSSWASHSKKHPAAPEPAPEPVNIVEGASTRITGIARHLAPIAAATAYFTQTPGNTIGNLALASPA